MTIIWPSARSFILDNLIDLFFYLRHWVFGGRVDIHVLIIQFKYLELRIVLKYDNTLLGYDE